MEFLKLVSFIDLASGESVFQRRWRWPYGRDSDVDKTVTTLLKFAQEIDDGHIRRVDFQVPGGHPAPTRMLCHKVPPLAIVLFYEIPNPSLALGAAASPENRGYEGYGLAVPKSDIDVAHSMRSLLAELSGRVPELSQAAIARAAATATPAEEPSSTDAAAPAVDTSPVSLRTFSLEIFETELDGMCRRILSRHERKKSDESTLDSLTREKWLRSGHDY